MKAALLALAASVGWGVADFLGGLKSRTIPVIAVLALAQPVGLVLIAIVVLVGDPGQWEDAALWAIPAAALGSIGIAAFYRSMAVGTISIVAPIASVGVLIPVVIGIASGERPSALQLAGIPLAIAGAVLASRETGSTITGARMAAGVPWAVVASITFGAYFPAMNAAADADVLWASLVFKATAASLLVAAFLVTRPQVRASHADLATIGLIGVSDSSANVFFAASAAIGLVSVVSVLASLYPVVTVALAWLVLRERVQPLQRAGVAGALAGVVLISAG